MIGRARARFGAAVATFDADGDGKLDLYLAAAVDGPEGGPRRPPAQQGRRAVRGRHRRLRPARGPREPGRRRGRLRRRPQDRPVPDRRRRRTACSATRGKRFEDVTERRGRRRAARRQPDGPLARPRPGRRPRPLRRQLRRPRATRTPASATTAAAGHRRTRPTATTASPRRSRADRADNWAPLAVATADLPGDGGAVDRVHALARRRGAARRRRRRTRRSPRSTSTTTATSTSSSPPTARRRRPSSTTGSGGSTPATIERPDAPDAGLRPARDRPRQGRPRRPRRRSRRRAGSSPGGTRPGRPPGRDARLGVLADRRRRLAVGRGRRPRPRRLARPARPAAAAGEAPPSPGPGTRGRGSRPSRSPSGPTGRSSRRSGLRAGRPRRRPAARPPARRRRASRRGSRGTWATASTGWRSTSAATGRSSFDQMRTNPHGLGTRVALEGQGLHVTYDHTTPEAGLAQSVGAGRARAGPDARRPRCSGSAGPTASCSAS